MDYLIIGAGVAGISAVRELIKKRGDNDTIRVISSEPYPFYYRPRLIECLSGEVGIEDIIIHKQSWFEKNQILLHLSERAIEINYEKMNVKTEKATYRYDKLLLATGAHSFIPPIKGVEKENIFSLRTAEDAKRIYQKVSSARKAVVIGGGLLGLESAYNFSKAGLEVAVVETLDWLLPRQLDQEGGGVLRGILEKKGLNIYLGVGSNEFIGDEQAKAVKLSSGEVLEADLVLLSTGIRSNTGLLGDLQSKCAEKGIKVNKYLETAIQDVYSAGDSAEYQGIVYGIWNPSQLQGKVAGLNMAGTKEEFVPPLASHKLKVADVNVISLRTQKADDDYNYQIEQSEDGYQKVFLDHEDKPVGAIIIGDVAGSDQVLADIKSIL